MRDRKNIKCGMSYLNVVPINKRAYLFVDAEISTELVGTIEPNCKSSASLPNCHMEMIYQGARAGVIDQNHPNCIKEG
jgi:hypothetical protein